VSIESEYDLEALRAAGAVVAATLRAMSGAAVAGITTAELDGVGACVLAERGARSAPRLTYGFPGDTCISVNDEAVHGVPGGRRLETGDLVKIDVSAELGGYVADACVTVTVGPVAAHSRALCAAARAALARGIAAARPGAPLSAIGRAVEGEARRRGFRVLRELTGHGVGRSLHEPPTVFHYDEPSATEPLTQGLVLTIEPALSAGAGRLVHGGDGWTLRTRDGTASAQYEHTVVVWRGGARVLTAY
jgi:methionyl aminopeptidase